MDKQGAALAALVSAISNCLIAFGAVNAVLGASVNMIGSGIAGVVLYYLHRRDNAVSQ